MLNLSKAIFSKLSGSSLESIIGSRLYKGRAPESATYPYVVFQIVSNRPDNVFSGYYEETLIQFSLYSSNSSHEEVENMYTYLKALYEEQDMTISSETLIWMRRENAVLMVEDHTVRNEGTIRVWHYAISYRITTKV